MLDRAGGWFVGVAIAAFLVVLAQSQRELPRCPEGLVPLGARCCGAGQRLEAGRCVGVPSRCGDGLELHGDGCVAPRRRVVLAAGESSWRPPDTTVGAGEVARTSAFALDAYEVTWSDWGACVAGKACPAAGPPDDPGQAVSGVTLGEARGFCRFVGGRLPTDAEWLRAAIGEVERRYPWGDPDALCLRAAFALDGRCARGARGPDTAGARPWGKTASGIHDLAGNVAEWVEEGAPAGSAAVRGGSFRERDATSLRPRWRRVLADDSRHDWVGFRCAYDVK